MPREKISASPRSKSAWTCDGLAVWVREGVAVPCARAKEPIDNMISDADIMAIVRNLCIGSLYYAKCGDQRMMQS
jgi:hypothetical protein